MLFYQRISACKVWRDSLVVISLWWVSRITFAIFTLVMFAERVQMNISSLESTWLTVSWQQVFYWRPSNHRARLWSVHQSWSQSILERSVATISSSSWVLFKALFNHLRELSITTAMHFARIPKQPTLLWSNTKERSQEQDSRVIIFCIGFFIVNALWVEIV